MSGLYAKIGEDNLQNVVSLKVSGDINGYDIMLMRNKMDNLHYLDLTDANIVANDYQYYTGYHTEDSVLGGYRFYSLDKLISVKLPKSIMAIAPDAFRSCSYLREVTFQEGLQTIGSYAFYGCMSLKGLTLPAGLKTIGSQAFRFISIEQLILPEGLVTIGDGYFTNNSNLQRVAFPSTLQQIGSQAFHGCSNLDNISLPTSVERIMSQTFYGCSSLKEVRIPSSLSYIGAEAFAGCSALQDVYTYIAEPPSIALSTFGNYQNTTLWVPSTSFYNYWYDTEWSQFRQVKSFDADYEYFYVNKDFTIGDDQGTLQGDGIDVDITPGADPQVPNAYHLYLEASQTGCCTFNRVSGASTEGGQTVTVAARNVSPG